MNDLKLADFLMKNMGYLDKWQDGYSETIEEFWNAIVEPLLPKKETMEKLLDMLVKYCDEPDAVFAIRAFAEKDSEQAESDKTTVRRRGFLTHTNVGLSFFYTDNYFAPYFQKMALNDYVPEYDEFKSMMLNRTFPARYAPRAGVGEAEGSRAAYDIQGKYGIDPGYGTVSHYKLSHIFDVGEGYWIEDKGKSYKRSDVCDGKEFMFFPRGNYEDWQWQDEIGIYVRNHVIDESKAQLARKWLKAQFLRLVCPLNYTMTPQKDYQRTIVKLGGNDIGEEPKFQKYAMYRFKQLYGEVFERYCSYLMLEPGLEGVDYGDEVIKLEYSSKIGEETKKKRVLNKANKEMPGEEEYALIREFLCDEDFNFTRNEYKILEKYGFNKSMQGILTRVPIQELIVSSESKLMAKILLEIEQDLVF